MRRRGTHQVSLEPLASITRERIGTFPPVVCSRGASARCENDAGGLFQHPANEHGVALLLALLVLALLVALILEFDTEARREYHDAAAFRDNFKATVLTRAAVQAARAVLQQDFLKDRQTGQFYDAPTDLWAFPIQQYAIGDGLLTAQIEDERSKLNLNDLAGGGDLNARKTKVLRAKRLFELLQVSPDLVDAIVDWVDQDEVPEPAGAESLYYQNLKPPYRAANAPLQTLRELRLIKGMTADNFEKIARLVTVYPQEGEGRVNINTAESAVLQSLDPRISQAVAGEIIQGRPYRTIQELDRVGSFEAVGKELRLQNAYDIKSDIFSARMTLTINDVVKQALVTLRRDPNTGSSTVLYYRIL